MCREAENPAADEFVPFVQAGLRRLAAGYSTRGRASLSLYAEGPVYAAFERLQERDDSADAGPDAFFAVASRCLREILVEHARARAALTVGSVLHSLTIIELDDALNELALIEPRMSQAIELRCFAGPGKEQIAGTPDIEPAIVSRELRFAEAWLKRRLSQ
jgi:hypothetical protein